MRRRFRAEHAIVIILKSSQSTVVTENATYMRNQICLLFRGGHLEVRIVQGNVRFNFVDGDSSVVARVVLRTGVDRERVIHASNLLIRTEVLLGFTHRATNELLLP